MEHGLSGFGVLVVPSGVTILEVHTQLVVLWAGLAKEDVCEVSFLRFGRGIRLPISIEIIEVETGIQVSGRVLGQ